MSVTIKLNLPVLKAKLFQMTRFIFKFNCLGINNTSAVPLNWIIRRMKDIGEDFGGLVLIFLTMDEQKDYVNQNFN